MHAIVARNLAPTPPVSDLFGKTGRHWLARQPLPGDEHASMQALSRQLDFRAGELAAVDKELAVEALTDPVVARLMTIPGIDAIAGISIVAAVGDFSRFDDPDKLVAYVRLNPKVRQSGNSAQDAAAEGGSAIRRLLGRARTAWEDGFLWVAFVIGSASAPFDTALFVVTFIVASGAAIGTQVQRHHRVRRRDVCGCRDRPHRLSGHASEIIRTSHPHQSMTETTASLAGLPLTPHDCERIARRNGERVLKT